MSLHSSYLFELLKAGRRSAYQGRPDLSLHRLRLFTDSKNRPGNWRTRSVGHLHVFLDGDFYLRDSGAIDSGNNLDSYVAMLDTERPADVEKRIVGGLYNLFTIDDYRGVLEISSDLLGAVPVYVYEDSERILITGNQFNLAPYDTVDETALVEFLKYGYLPFSDSFYVRTKRIEPWERMVVDLRTGNIRTEAFATIQYSGIGQRENDVQRAVGDFHEALSCYFDRFGDERLLIGLSGGYDSRLLVAYLSEKKPKLVHFGYTDSSEAQLAGAVAGSLGLEVETERFPVDLPARHGAHLRTNFRVVQSLELSHVLHLHDRAALSGCDFYVDGFVGDTVLGSSYFYDVRNSPGGVAGFLTGRANVDQPTASSHVYEGDFYDGKDCIADARLRDVLTEEARARFRRRVHELYDRNYFGARSHEDMTESLTYLTRARKLIAGGPVGTSARVQVACPFIDHAVLQLSFNVDKSMLIGNKLYNALWRTCFPGLAHIRKAGQGGNPANTDAVYRMRYLIYAARKKTIQRFLQRISRGRIRHDDTYFSYEDYLADPKNQEMFGELLKHEGEGVLGSMWRRSVRNGEISGANPRLYLRYLSLFAYLQDQS